MHAMFRRYRVRLGAADAAARQTRLTLLPLLREVPGFAAYYLVDSGDGVVASIALFKTREGAALGERLAEEWFRDDWPVFRALAPTLASGEVLVAEEAQRQERPEIAGAGGPRREQRGGGDRRFRRDRRAGRERRVAGSAVPLSAAT